MNLNDTDLFREKCYIDGKWVTTDARTPIEVINPATGEKIKIKAKNLPKFRPGKAWKDMF